MTVVAILYGCGVAIVMLWCCGAVVLWCGVVVWCCGVLRVSSRRGLPKTGRSAIERIEAGASAERDMSRGLPWDQILRNNLRLLEIKSIASFFSCLRKYSQLRSQLMVQKSIN